MADASRPAPQVESQEGKSQEDVFRLLADPETHGLAEEDGETVRRIDTHAAVVFLAGDLVFKVKRAGKYPFLDYSPPDRRKAPCLAELESIAPSRHNSI